MSDTDFTSIWVETDGSTPKLSQTSSAASFAGLLGSAETLHLNRDYGANWKTGDFHFRFNARISAQSHATNSRVNLLIVGVSAFAEFAESFESLRVRAISGGTTSTTTLTLDRLSATGTQDTPTETATLSTTLTVGTRYYFEMERASLATTLKVYSDSGYTTQVGSTLTVTESTAMTLRYATVTGTWWAGAATTITGDVSNLDFDYVAATTLTPSAASMTMTGATPTVTTTGNQTLAPAAASLAMTGATPTVSAQAYTWYALPAPGAYDSNSILAGQTYPTGSWLRVVTDFAHITYDYAAAEAAGELDNDINDHAVADSGYTGSDSATFEIKTPAGATAQYTVNVTIQETGITAGPSAATLAMTGATPTVTTGGNQTLSPAAASMTMTGATPTITGTTTSVAPAAASMVMTGGVPSVSNSNFTPSTNATNQGNQQGAFRALALTTLDYNGDFIAAMRADLADDTGDINGLMIRWLQQKLGSSNASLSGLMAEAANDRGVSRWAEITNPLAIGT